MRVKLINAPDTKTIINTIYMACRQCYSPGFIGDIDLEKIPTDKKIKLIKKVFKSGHHSTLEHISFTFAVEGLSRNCTHQLVRHRLASFSQQSFRYCNPSNSSVIIPDSFLKDGDAAQDLLALAQIASNFYKKYEERGLPNEDLRAFLLSSWMTNIVLTMNIRELIHFFGLRMCKQAQKEIRDLANEMHRLCTDILPEIFSEIGPKCKLLGYCDEGDRSCGLMPLKEDIEWYSEELQYRKRLFKNALILNEKFDQIFKEIEEGGNWIESDDSRKCD